jgi:hypothetical protein
MTAEYRINLRFHPNRQHQKRRPNTFEIKSTARRLTCPTNVRTTGAAENKFACRDIWLNCCPQRADESPSFADHK